jgi:hypothetical protein
VLITRIFAVSAFGLALATGALAPTTPTPAAPSGTFQGVKEQHPDWFKSNTPYRPCPASVEFSDGRPACLGCPTRCAWHFRRGVE